MPQCHQPGAPAGAVVSGQNSGTYVGRSTIRVTRIVAPNSVVCLSDSRSTIALVRFQSFDLSAQASRRQSAT